MNFQSDERQLIARLRDGDEAAFTTLVDRHHRSMIRVARSFVRDDATAEEVVQDAWLGVLNGIANFEGRSTLKSWIFSVVVNRAKTRGVRDARSVPFSSLAFEESSQPQAAVDPDRFLGPDARWPGHWAQPPDSWGENPENRLLQREALAHLSRILDGLHPAQRSVITMRDIAGHDTPTVCNILGISETNMRVLLHRARSKVRNELERYFSETATPSGTTG